MSKKMSFGAKNGMLSVKKFCSNNFFLVADKLYEVNWTVVVSFGESGHRFVELNSGFKTLVYCLCNARIL